MRTWGWLLSAKAHLEIVEGKYDQAVGTLQTGLALARHVAQGQSLVHPLVGSSIAGLMTKQIEQFIQQPDAPNLYWALATLPRPLVDYRPGFEAGMNLLYLQFPELRDLDKKDLSAQQWRELLYKVVREIEPWEADNERWAVVGGKQRPNGAAMATIRVVQGYPRAKQYLIEHGRPAAEVEAMPVAQVVLLHAVSLYEELNDDYSKWAFLPYMEGKAGRDHGDRSLHDACRREIIPLATVFTPANAAAGDAPVQVVLIPPASARRVIEELVPQLPKEVDNGPSTILTHGIAWAAARLNLPPQAALRLVIKSQDAQSARMLHVKWLAVLRFCREVTGKDAATRQFLPQVERLAALLVPKVETDRLTLTLDEKDHAISELLTLLNVPLERARDAARRLQSMNNLKQIALAMHQYNDAFQHFPSPASYDRSGKPLLSWRVHILPYLGQQQLYRQFHLDEPWDSPHNKALIETMPAEFRSPRSKAARGFASYLVPVGGGALYSSMKDQPTIKDITDGLSQTIMTIEVDDAHAVIWTKPVDLPFDPQDPRKGLDASYETGYPVGMCDGSARILPKTIDAKDLKALITRAAGDVSPRISD
jgi:hypothetical protein